jgi:hypothetical protein
VLRTGAAHGSLLRQFGAGERTVYTCDTALTTVERLPPCSPSDAGKLVPNLSRHSITTTHTERLPGDVAGAV